jgi:hypothetical protein
MNFGEFVSDQFVSLQYQHKFEGFFMNRIPLMKKLKWRLVGTANILYGGMSQANRTVISTNTPNGEEALPVGYLDYGKPYVELGYGIENIFKFFRLDFIHRLTYLTPRESSPDEDIRKFGVLVSFQFTL